MSELETINRLLLPLEEKYFSGPKTNDPLDKRNFAPKLYKKNTTIISENEYVAVKLPSSGMKLVELKKGAVIPLGKFGMFHVDQVLGYKFGQTFEVVDDETVKPVDRNVWQVDEKISYDSEAGETGSDSAQLETPQPGAQDTFSENAQIIKRLLEHSEDNSSLVDLGSDVQKLTTADIELMKKQSVGSENGRQIIEAIVKEHKNFSKKTKYSQAKYLRRKNEKYARFFVIDYLSPQTLLKYYLDSKDLKRNLDISEETVAYALNLANVRPGGRYLIMDESSGIFTYFMLERMQGQGEVVVLSENEHPNLLALTRYSNYPATYINKMVKSLSWLQLLSPVPDLLQTDDSLATFETHLREAQQHELESPGNNNAIRRTHFYRKLHNYCRLMDTLRAVHVGNFDGLILVTTLYIPTVLEKLVAYVGGSRPVVIYSQFKELLSETFQYVSSHKLPILGTAIYETRARYYQAIPGKIHPVMTMASGGGYLLTGLRVLPMESVQAVGRGKKKQKSNSSAPAPAPADAEPAGES